jgi:hypothetical protein
MELPEDQIPDPLVLLHIRVFFTFSLQILTSTTKKCSLFCFSLVIFLIKIAGHDFARDLPEDVVTKNYTKVGQKVSTKYKIETRRTRMMERSP